MMSCKSLSILFLAVLSFSFCRDAKKQAAETGANEPGLYAEGSEEPDTLRITADNELPGEMQSCSTYIDNVLTDFFTSDTKKIGILEMKNGLVYIGGKGILDLSTGRLFDLKDESGRRDIYRVLQDSIICLRTASEQHVYNLISDYQYYKKTWDTEVFRFSGAVESYNGSIVPVFENDSTLMLVELSGNRILKRISGGGSFHRNITRTQNYFYVGNKSYLYKVDRRNGAVSLEIKLSGGLGSDVIAADNKLIYLDKDRGILAVDADDGSLIWEYAAPKPGTFIRMLYDDARLYFNDEKIKALDLKTGRMIWKDNAPEYATDNNNIAIVNGKYLITGIYFDSEAVIALFDKNTGEVICDGFEMPDQMGFDRYKFFHFTNENSFYAIEGGGYGYRIVRLKFKER